jgi:hypothetical protein
MEPLNERLIEAATKAFNGLASHGVVGDIIPLRAHISEFLFLNFLDISSEYKIDVYYHGTRSDFSRSIETNGMFDFTNPKYKVANGNVWGRGVYVTPSINFAMEYSSPDGIVVVVLVIKGVEASKNEIVSGNHDLLADSQSPTPSITVLRSTCQALPIFAIPCKSLTRDPRKNCAYDCDHVASLLTSPPDSEVFSTAVDLKALYPEVKLGVIYQLLLRKQLDATIADLNDLDYSQY